MKEIMSWLFKVPTNSGLAQFDHHTQLNSGLKNGLNAKKIKLAQMNFFLKHNYIIKISCTSWPIHSAKFLKKILRADPELWGCAIFRPQMAYLSWTIFFGTKYYCYFHMCLLALFIVQNFKKFLRWVQSYEDVPFMGRKYPNLPRAKFFGTNHYYYFHLLR